MLRFLSFFFGTRIYRWVGNQDAGWYLYIQHKSAWLWQGHKSPVPWDITGPYLSTNDIEATPKMKVGGLRRHVKFHTQKPEGATAPLRPIRD